MLFNHEDGEIKRKNKINNVKKKKYRLNKKK
jgi:hypothetical protein